ncbi:MAG: entericidin A/B family lipoprotein [Pseudomonadota bacterium]|nr:entericidin A/B family lipoprotein [Pseudomonadota bacterium]
MTTPQKWILFGVVKVLVLTVAVGVVFSIYGCNTVRGVGQDIQKAGEKVGGAIERAGNK